jgi:hypothetical protein
MPLPAIPPLCRSLPFRLKEPFGLAYPLELEQQQLPVGRSGDRR